MTKETAESGNSSEGNEQEKGKFWGESEQTASIGAEVSSCDRLFQMRRPGTKNNIINRGKPHVSDPYEW